MIDFDWYRSFVAIYQIGTVSGAAKTLFFTQSAVSQQLAALEAAMGEPLFTRTARKMIPTAQGKALYYRIAQPLEILEQVAQEAHLAPLEPPLLRCGSPLEYFSEMILPRIKQFPYRLRFQFGETHSLIEELEKRTLDVVIATQYIPSHSIKYHKLGDEHFILVSAPHYKGPNLNVNLTEEERLKNIEHWLSAQTWISYGADLPLIRRFWQQCFGKHPQLQAAFVLPNLHAIAKAVEAAIGISILPEYLCRESLDAGRLQIIWEPSQTVTNELWLAHHKIDHNHSNIQDLQAILNNTLIMESPLQVAVGSPQTDRQVSRGLEPLSVHREKTRS